MSDDWKRKGKHIPGCHKITRQVKAIVVTAVDITNKFVYFSVITFGRQLNGFLESVTSG